MKELRSQTAKCEENRFFFRLNNFSRLNFYKNLNISIGIIIMLVAASTFAAPKEHFFDWELRNLSPGVSLNPYYNNCPLPGHDYAAGHQYNRDTFTALYNNMYQMAMTLANDTGPAHGTTDSNALLTVMGYVERLDYVFADFEGDVPPVRINADDVDLMVSQVRNSANPSCRAAYVGNYNWYSGVEDQAYIWPQDTDRTYYDTLYTNSGLNCAMPVCYPNETHCVHTWTYIWANFICPNARSAIFWAPLEHYSVAKRNLLSGHRIIPWIAGWIPYEDSNAYDCSPPSRSDCRALIQHLRLRGADGYYNLCGNWNPNYTDNDDYRMDMRDAWKTLDDNATNIGVKSIINLATDKVAGIQWSGVRNGNDVKILISNLGNVSQSVNYPSIFGLPAASPAVAPGQHVFYDYTISNLVKNPGFEPGATGWYLCAGATWQSTGGVENSPCIKMQGGYYSFISSDLFPTEGGAKMCIDVSACGVSSPNLMICYYYYDKDGVVLGVGNPGFDKAIGSTMQGYVSAFTVVNEPRIKYIGLIFYNKYGLTDPNDIIYVDNVSLRFSDNLVKNPGFEPGATGWYLCAGATWQSTGGVENSPCIKMQGGYYSFISSDLFPTEGGAKMCIDVSACGVSSPNLMICYYYYDKDGVVLGVGNPGFDKAIGSTMQGYVSAFTVVNDPRIKYIGLIFYNKYGLTDPNDIIYVDNVSLKFSE